jgi:hypothetical protein
MIQARDRADALAAALERSAATVQTQCQSLELALMTVSAVRNLSKDREVRVRVRNLRRAVAAIVFEVEKVGGARDNLTRRLAAAAGVSVD